MNSIYSHYTACFLILTTLSAQASITVNGRDINTIAKPGQMIVYKVGEGENIAFRFDKNTNSLQFGSVESMTPQHVKEVFEQLRGNLSTCASRNVTMQSPLIYGQHCIAVEKIMIKPIEESVAIENSLLESPNIAFIASQVKLIGCFIKNGRYLQLESPDKDSLFKIIRFKLAKDTDAILAAQGAINLGTGEMPGNFVVTGASKVQMMLHDKAFSRG